MGLFSCLETVLVEILEKLGSSANTRLSDNSGLLMATLKWTRQAKEESKSNLNNVDVWGVEAERLTQRVCGLPTQLSDKSKHSLRFASFIQYAMHLK